MNYDGKYLIMTIVKRLEDEDIRVHDSAILAKLKVMTKLELNVLLTFGDVVDWHNERINKCIKSESGNL